MEWHFRVELIDEIGKNIDLIVVVYEADILLMYCLSLLIYILFILSVSVGLSPNVPTPGSVSSAALFPGGPSPSTLSALVSQHRLLELSRFGLRGYDLAQHMLTQQGAVSKLLGKFVHIAIKSTIFSFI